MPNTNLKITGKLHIKLFDEFGKLKDERFIDNLVVTTGKTFICSRMAGTTYAVMSHMAVGSGSTAAAAGDTALETEITRVALTSTTPSTSSITYVGDYPAGTGTGTISEAGILNNSVGGTLLCRTTFTAIPKGASDTLSISWTITAS